MGNLIKSNDFKPSYFYKASIKHFNKKAQHTDYFKEELQDKKVSKCDYELDKSIKRHK